MIEQWKDIPGYEGLYQVSNMGNVKSLNYKRTGKEALLKPSITKGYLYLCLSDGDKHKKHRIHQLVAIVFLGHKPDGLNIVINHIDRNPLNNCVDNLEIVTPRYNSTEWRTDAGVNWNKDRNKWRTQIHINKKYIHIGLYDDKQEALDMYQLALANTHLYQGDAKAFRLSLKQLVRA
jgi:hypothetical protein